MSHSKLICVEDPAQVQSALDYAALHFGQKEVVWLALTPHVEYEFKRIGVAHRRPEDSYEEDELHALGSLELERVSQLCRFIHDCIGKSASIYQDMKVNFGDLSWYHLKILVNSVVVPAFIAQRILDQEQPESILYFGPLPLPRESYFDYGSAWADCFQLASRFRKIPCEIFHFPSTARPKTTIRMFLERILRQRGLSRVRSIYKRMRALTTTGLAWHKRRGKGVIVFLSLSYSLGVVARKLTHHDDFRLMYWEVAQGEAPIWLDTFHCLAIRTREHGKNQYRPDATMLWDELKAAKVEQLFNLNGLNFFSLVELRLRQYVFTTLPTMAETYQAAIRLLEEHKPVAIIAATLGHYTQQMVGAAAKALRIPMVIYKHGSSGAYVLQESGSAARDFASVTYHNDILSSDVYLVNGEGDREFYLRYFKCQSQIVPVGSAHLDELRRRREKKYSRRTLCLRYGIDPNRRVILYAPTTMDGTIRPIPFRSRSPSKMFEIEQALLDVVREFQDCEFIFKPQNNPVYPISPITAVIADSRLRNCHVVTDPLSKVLAIADAFVFDYPSTAFLEALTTDRPILLCGHELPWKWSAGVWHPSILEMWRERVLYADGLNDFLEMFRAFLSKNDFEPRKDTTLLRLYGTHLDDGNSAGRARDLLLSLTESSV